MLTSLLEINVEDIDGKRTSLQEYQGKVLLIVNVASRCGFTNQYADLQTLHERYHARGLAILAFPANNFLWQEPGSNEQIKDFCQSHYSVGFDLFAKVSVGGRRQCDLYRFLTSRESNPEFGGRIKWNFTKFLIDRTGQVRARFEPRIKPTDARLIEVLEALLLIE
jgi:glutathione peroxidase